jgi:hypothetical protein
MDDATRVANPLRAAHLSSAIPVRGPTMERSGFTLGSELREAELERCIGNASSADEAIGGELLEDERVIRRILVEFGTRHSPMRWFWDLLMVLVALATCGTRGYCCFSMRRRPASGALFVTDKGRILSWRYNGHQGCCSRSSAASIRSFPVDQLANVRLGRAYSSLGCLGQTAASCCCPARALHETMLIITFRSFPSNDGAIHESIGLPAFVFSSPEMDCSAPEELFRNAAPSSWVSVINVFAPLFVAVRALLALPILVLTSAWRAGGLLLSACLCFRRSVDESVSEAVRAMGGIPGAGFDLRAPSAGGTEQTISIRSSSKDIYHSDGDHGWTDMLELQMLLLEMKNDPYVQHLSSSGSAVSAEPLTPFGFVGNGWRTITEGSKVPLLTPPDVRDPATHSSVRRLGRARRFNHVADLSRGMGEPVSLAPDLADDSVDEAPSDPLPRSRSVASAQAVDFDDSDDEDAGTDRSDACFCCRHVGLSTGDFVVNLDTISMLPLVRGERIITVLPSRRIITVVDVAVLCGVLCALFGNGASVAMALTRNPLTLQRVQGVYIPSVPIVEKRDLLLLGFGGLASILTGILSVGIALQDSSPWMAMLGISFQLLPLCCAMASYVEPTSALVAASAVVLVVMLSASLAIFYRLLQLKSSSLAALVLTSHRVVSVAVRSIEHASTGALSGAVPASSLVESWWLASGFDTGWVMLSKYAAIGEVVTPYGVLRFSPMLGDFWPWRHLFGIGLSLQNRSRLESFFQCLSNYCPPRPVLLPGDFPRGAYPARLQNPRMWDPYFEGGERDGFRPVDSLVPLCSGEHPLAFIESLDGPEACLTRWEATSTCGLRPSTGLQRAVATDRRLWAVAMVRNRPVCAGSETCCWSRMLRDQRCMFAWSHIAHSPSFQTAGAVRQQLHCTSLSRVGTACPSRSVVSMTLSVGPMRFSLLQNLAMTRRDEFGGHLVDPVNTAFSRVIGAVMAKRQDFRPPAMGFRSDSDRAFGTLVNATSGGVALSSAFVPSAAPPGKRPETLRALLIDRGASTVQGLVNRAHGIGLHPSEHSIGVFSPHERVALAQRRGPSMDVNPLSPVASAASLDL